MLSLHRCTRKPIYATDNLSAHKIWYPLSKILAERAALDFCKANGIDLVTVLPTFVVGPSLPPDLCSTASDILGLLKGNQTLILI